MSRTRTGARKAPAKGEEPKAQTEAGKRPLAADSVFNSLAGAILRGKFVAGASLPPERELAALFNVSRLIVRQALHRLREIGLVHGGQGGQTTVLDPDLSSDPRIIALTMQLAPKAADEQDVMERQLIGGATVLDLAMQHISDAEIEELAALLGAISAKVAAEGEVTDKEASDFETTWWTRLAMATGNRILLRESRWWFDIVKEQPGRYARLYGSKGLALRVQLYQVVLDHMRKRQEVTHLYLTAVRPLFARKPRA